MTSPRPHGVPASARDVIRRSSWAWLSALTREARVGVDLLDESAQVCLLQSTPADQPALSRRSAALLSHAKVQRAARAALDRGLSGHLTVDDLDVALVPITLQHATGVLVATRDRREPASETTMEISRLAASLARAIEAHTLDATDQASVEAFDTVSSLNRRLHDAVERGGEADVVTAFAEAVFAWDGIEVSGYVTDIDGDLSMVVSAPGTRRGRRNVKHARTLSPGALERLSPEEIEFFGFERTRTVLVADLRSTSLEPWTLVFADGFGAVDEGRVRLYADLLRDALSRAAAVAETRFVWSVLQPLLGNANVDVALSASLTELSRALTAQGAALTVTASTGVRLLSVGDDESQSSVRQFGKVNRLAATTPGPDGASVEVSIRRPGHHFTRREQHLLERALVVFATWLNRNPATRLAAEASKTALPEFAQVLDRAAAQAVSDGTDVGLVVIAAPDQGPHAAADLMPAWVAEFRRQLRGADLAGALSDHEVGLLLLGVGAADVARVGARIYQQTVKGQFAGLTRMSLGFASRTAGSAADVSLVTEARTDAARHLKHATEGRG